MNDSVVDFLGPTDLHVETNGVVTGLSQTHAYVFIEELSSAWKERERLDVLVLRAICRLSVKHPERANEGFSSLEIVEVVGALRGRRWSEGNDKNQLSLVRRVRCSGVMFQREKSTGMSIRPCRCRGVAFSFISLP